MEKICPYCGRLLEEGEHCTCPQSILLEHEREQRDPSFSPAQEDPTSEKEPGFDAAPKEAPPSPGPAPRYPSRISSAFSNILPFFKAYLRSPSQTVDIACRHHDLPLGLLYLILPLASFTLFFLFSLFHILDGLASFLSQLSSLIPFAGSVGGQITLDLPHAILAGLLMPLTSILILSLGTCLAGKLARVSLPFSSAFLSCVFSSILPSLLLLIATPLLFLSPLLAGAFACLAFLSWLLLLFDSLLHLCACPSGSRFTLSLVGFLGIFLLLAGVLCLFILDFSLDAVSVTSPLFEYFPTPSNFHGGL